MPDDDPEEIVTPAAVERISRGALPADKFTPDRQAIYTFRGRIAQQWRIGNIFLAGDAAHQAPPLFGQGLCAGIRDVANLVWKLDLVQPRRRRRVASGHLRERAQAARRGLGRDGGQSGRHHPDHRPRRRGRPRRVHRGQPGRRVRAAAAGPRAGSARRRHRRRAGHLGPQPMLADGTRLDDMVGPHFLVATDRALYAGPADRDQARAGRRRRHRHAARPGQDRQLLGAVDARAVVLRPDHYILGVADTAVDLERLIRSIPSHRATSRPPRRSSNRIRSTP